MKTVYVTVRRVYGNRVIYPACDTARDFARTAGTKTLTPATLRKIQALGYTVTETHENQLQEAMQ